MISSYRPTLHPISLALGLALITSATATASATTGAFDKKEAKLSRSRSERVKLAAEQDGLRQKLDDAIALDGR